MNETVLIIYTCMTLFGILAPIIGFVFWIKKTKQPVRTLLIGMATFFIFAIVLETIPKVILLDPNTTIGNTILSNSVLYILIGALLAGIFEEMGRYVAFKRFLKNQNDKLTAITYGIGHAGFEILYILGLGSIQSLLMAILVYTGNYHDLMMMVELQNPGQYEILQSLPQVLSSVTFLTMGMAFLERMSATLIHISCSIIVFKAVHTEGKAWMIQLAIFLHASIDVIAGMYQVGMITNLVVVEMIIFGWAILFFYLCFQYIYKKMGAD